ncbi:MAG: LysR family transcriptional regulator [Ramlibacter sp.]|jgi:DNA-binding transcriptional LysR family regulator|nr:LysR family transcriptional regulator [Ramlibacter sp.]
MQIRQLECFRALMLSGTMTRAAEELGITQPAVSGTIAGLEKEIGFTLFSRQGGRLIPTEEAHLFFNEVSRSLSAMESMERAVAEIREGKRGSLSIAAYPSISIALLPRILSLFMACRPDIRINLVSRSSYVVKELVSTQQFDLAIAELPTDHPLDRMEKFSYRCDCILPTDHPLASREVITTQDLDGLPFISLFRDHTTHHQLARAFSASGSKWNVVAEVQYFASVCELVAAGCGVGLADPVVSSPFTGEVVRRRFEPAVSYEIGLLHPDRPSRSVIADEFIALVRQHLAQLLSH